MSSARYAAPLRLELRRSRRLALYLIATHAGALALIPLLPLGALTGTLLAALIALSLAREYPARVLLRGDRAVVALVWTAEGDWRLLERGGRTRECRLRPGSFRHPLLTVLGFGGGRRCAVVLLPDSLDRDSFRRLRVRLGLRGTGVQAPDYPA